MRSLPARYAWLFFGLVLFGILHLSSMEMRACRAEREAAAWRVRALKAEEALARCAGAWESGAVPDCARAQRVAGQGEGKP